MSKRFINIILCCAGFFGFPAGLHRFHRKQYGTGILWLLTAGLLWIGTIYDLIILLGTSDEEFNKEYDTIDSLDIRTPNIGKLEQLHELKEKGIITEEEFQEQKKKYLG